ncbi:MAG: hypothetical protein HKO58_05660, partial [Gammaproteobacteria bacterium]|nr:hypothetical protein [Gammaproteobacteria bacterium]
YTTGVASGDDRPTEEVAFYYNKITYTYQKQKPDGSKDKQSFKFDMKKCKS